MATPFRLEDGRLALQQARYDDARAIYRTIAGEQPGQYRAWLALSALAQREGSFREALACARNAAGAWTRNGQPLHLADIAMRLLALGDYQPAVELIAHADWSADATIRQGALLAQYLDLAGLHDQALRAADAARRGDEILNPRLAFVRAGILQHLGKMQDAEAAYEQCIAADPLFAEAHWALAQHFPAAQPARRINRIRKAIAHGSGRADDMAWFWYALFSELDRVDDTAGAWAALTQGMKLKRTAGRYDAARDRTAHEAMQALFEKPAFAAQSAAGNGQAHAPLFVFGLPRSGTTLVERILSSHPRVASGGELGDLAMQLSWETDTFVGHDITAAQVRAIADIDFEAMGRAYIDRTRWRANAHAFLIDKFPGNFLFAGVIARAMPSAGMVAVRRNAMDSCFSLLKQVFSGNAYGYSYSLEDVAAHHAAFEKLCGHWRAVLGERLLLIDYEDLVAAPEAGVEKLRVYCGLEPDAAMMHPHRNPLPSATASAAQVRMPMHAGFIGQWRRYEKQLEPLRERLECAGIG